MLELPLELLRDDRDDDDERDEVFEVGFFSSAFFESREAKRLRQSSRLRVEVLEDFEVLELDDDFFFPVSIRPRPPLRATYRSANSILLNRPSLLMSDCSTGGLVNRPRLISV